MHFYVDQKADRVGVLTTEDVKHAMVQLVNVMLAEHRIHLRNPLISSDPAGIKRKLREQMETYSYQVFFQLLTKSNPCSDFLCYSYQVFF